MTRDALRQELLNAALPHVPFDGWTDATLAAAAESVGASRFDLDRVFPGGVVDVIDYWNQVADASMVAGLAARDLSGMKLREKVALGIRLRFASQAQHQEAVRKALSALATPGRAALGPKLAWRSADALWRALGDGAADFSWYSKRASLAAILAAAALVWIDDHSDGGEVTAAFVDRRIDDLMRFGKMRGRVETLLARAPNPLTLLRRPA